MNKETQPLSQFENLPKPTQEYIQKLLAQNLFLDAKRLYDSFLEALKEESD